MYGQSSIYGGLGTTTGIGDQQMLNRLMEQQAMQQLEQQAMQQRNLYSQEAARLECLTESKEPVQPPKSKKSLRETLQDETNEWLKGAI